MAGTNQKFNSSKKKELTINWYRCKLDKDTLKKLNKRSDLKGFIQTGGHLALIIFTAFLSIYAYQNWSWPILVLVLYLHGTVTSFAINAVHELVHGTVFKTKLLNQIFAGIFSFIGWINHRHFWGSHTEHHKYTLHPPDDLELRLPIKFSIRTFLSQVFIDLKSTIQIIKQQWRLALGKLDDDWSKHLFENKPERFAVFNWARILIIGHVSIIVVSLYFGLWIIPVVVTFPIAYGKLLFFLCNNTQHVGLQEHVPDYRLNTRTIYLNPIARFLYWNMNYHIEHHMYAGVPCYNLKKLHMAIKHELPYVPLGLIDTWFEIIGILWIQSKNPDYQYIPVLPGDKTAEKKR